MPQKSKPIVVQLSAESLGMLFLAQLLFSSVLMSFGFWVFSAHSKKTDKMTAIVESGQNETKLQLEDIKKSTDKIDCRLIYINQVK